MANVLRYDGTNQYTSFTANPFHQNRTQYRFEAKFTTYDLSKSVYFVARNNSFSSYISYRSDDIFMIRYAGTAVSWDFLNLIPGKQYHFVVTRDGNDHELFIDGQSEGIQTSTATSTDNVNVTGQASNSVYTHADIEYISLYDAPTGGSLLYNWSADASDRSNTGSQPVMIDTVAANNATGSNFPVDGTAWQVLPDPPIKSGDYNLSLTSDLFDIIGNVDKWVFDNNNDLSVITHSGSPDYNTTDNTVTFDRTNNDGMKSRANLEATQTTFTYVPNGAQGQNPSGGFTCTGLFKLASGNWLVGNDGREFDGDTNNPSLVELSSDFTTIVNEWDMSVINGPRSIQGVIEANDGTFYFASPVDGNLVNVTNTGALIDKEPLGVNINGLAYDPVNNYIWYSTVGSTISIEYDLATDTPTGKQITILDNTDQMYYQSSTKLLYCTAGNNGVNGEVNVVDTVVGYTVAIFADLQDCQAIEGIHVEGSQFFIANDGGFHTNANPARNIIFEYAVNLDQMYATRANNLYIQLSGKLIGSVPIDREALIQQSDPLTTGVGGWALYAMSTNRLRFEARDHFDDSNFYVEYNIARDVDFDFTIEVNTSTDTVVAMLNDVEVTPDGSFNDVSDLTGGLNAGLMDIGLNQQGTSYPGNIEISKLIVTNDPQEDGSVNVTMDDFTMSSIGQVGESVSGSIFELMDDFTMSASGSATNDAVGEINATMDDFLMSASGTLDNPVTGSVNVTMDDFILITPSFGGGNRFISSITANPVKASPINAVPIKAISK